MPAQKVSGLVEINDLFLIPSLTSWATIKLHHVYPKVLSYVCLHLSILHKAHKNAFNSSKNNKRFN